ncbi:RNA-directed DNA polymerase from mobile element jockey [Paramuricea clavata]|uniref:RNA-directed DNA polymerase from mobile element jockey n=1 Tax=Paramuricea clavata TaxID=317549 RepID=A0A7D9E408_PARCT|nr:RNA-directed DNA polymerase from mobile element jockey [Paramuricea clavata]
MKTASDIVDPPSRTAADNPAEIVNLFNRYFTSVFTSDCSPHYACKPDDTPNITNVNLTVYEIQAVLEALDVTKATGSDGIPARLLKETAEVIAPSLCCFFNKSLNTGTLPDEWKLANVVPIHKKGNAEYTENYRPIYLLPIVSKVLERCVLNNIKCHLHQLVHNSQHGFFTGKSWPPGSKGSQGIRGKRGSQGPRGGRGYNGTKGDRGAPGPRGIKGDAGDIMKSKEAPPKITTHPPKIIFINEGVNLTLNCIANRLPSALKRGKGTRLHFTKITYNKKGKYKCLARNSVGMASFDVKIIFKVPPRRLSSRETIVYKGNAVNLQCPVDSYPAAKIRWIKPGYTISNGDVAMVNNTLNIKRVKKEHEGIYLCEGKNMFGSTFTAVFVKVRSEVGPTFREKPPISKGVFRHQKVTVNCIAIGDPVPTITWTKRHEKLPITQETRVELMIKSFDVSDEGNYTCTAENALGSKVVTVLELYLIQCPGLVHPVNGHAINLNEDSNDVMIFSCDQKTQMIGPEIRVCQRNGTWTGRTTYCE